MMLMVMPSTKMKWRSPPQCRYAWSCRPVLGVMMMVVMVMVMMMMMLMVVMMMIVAE